MATSIDILSPADQEGTQAIVLRWLKQAGEAVKENEPLLEIETDKVTLEVPAPASGRLLEIVKNERDAVEPGGVLGRMSVVAADAGIANAAPAGGEQAGTHGRNVVATPATSSNGNTLLSPAVRRLLAEHRLDPAQIPASGRGGRLTAQDVTDYLGRQSAPPPTAAAPSDIDQGKEAASRRVPHSVMRRRIAEHMVRSVRAAPHVTTLFAADLSGVAAHRARHVQEFQARGVKLTYTAYFVAACVRGLQAVPEVNSHFHDDALEIFEDCNIGIGTALGNAGLIVPVLHRAQMLDLFSIAQRVGELVEGARAGRLSPGAVRGGTFTISNHGVSGSLLAVPIVINQPQVAILGTGKIEKRIVVEEMDGADAIRIKPMCFISLTIDHRALDAFQANAFLTTVMHALQSWS